MSGINAKNSNKESTDGVMPVHIELTKTCVLAGYVYIWNSMRHANPQSHYSCYFQAFAMLLLFRTMVIADTSLDKVRSSQMIGEERRRHGQVANYKGGDQNRRVFFSLTNCA